MELQVLCVAAQEGDLQAVAARLDEGGGVDERCAEHEGATLLMAAAGGGQEAVGGADAAAARRERQPD